MKSAAIVLTLGALLCLPATGWSTTGNAASIVECPDGTRRAGMRLPGQGERYCVDRKTRLREGPYVRTDATGAAVETGSFRAGERDGEWLRFSSQGVGLEQLHYVVGEKVGPSTRWYPDGRIAEDGFWLGGEPDGAWSWWAEGGQLERQALYDRGTLLAEVRPLSDGRAGIACSREGSEVAQRDSSGAWQLSEGTTCLGESVVAALCREEVGGRIACELGLSQKVAALRTLRTGADEADDSMVELVEQGLELLGRAPAEIPPELMPTFEEAGDIFLWTLLDSPLTGEDLLEPIRGLVAALPESWVSQPLGNSALAASLSARLAGASFDDLPGRLGLYHLIGERISPEERPKLETSMAAVLERAFDLALSAADAAPFEVWEGLFVPMSELASMKSGHSARSARMWDALEEALEAELRLIDSGEVVEVDAALAEVRTTLLRALSSLEAPGRRTGPAEGRIARLERKWFLGWWSSDGAEPFRLQLQGDGTGVVYLLGQGGEGRWSLHEDSLILRRHGVPIAFELDREHRVIRTSEGVALGSNDWAAELLVLTGQ